MDLDQLRAIIELVKQNELAEVEIEEEGRRVRVVAVRESAGAGPMVFGYPQQGGAPAGGGPATSGGGGAGAQEAEEAEGETINSPIVGTFYRAPSPESPIYVDVGDEFDEETVLCIVEAMKVMNEIKAESKGKILEILVENGDPVEFGQPLFRIAPAE